MSRFIDLTGQRFGKLTAVCIYERGSAHKPVKWECICDCGNRRIVESTLLRNKNVRHCGCGPKTKLIGERFGKLTVVSASSKRAGTNIVWVCKCDCGNYTEVSSSNLSKNKDRRGTISCGCVKREATVKHNQSKTRLYKTLVAIKGRCKNPKDRNYNSYGGRGIDICPEWDGENGYEKFISWALENGYQEGLTIDRIDNDKGYSPNNCRWVSQKTNSNNNRNCYIITINSESHTISEWADIKQIPSYVLYSRRQRGWTDYDVVMTPYLKRKNRSPV